MRRAGSPLAMIVLLPALTYYLWISLRDGGGALVPPSLALLGRIPPPTLTAAALYAAWFALQLALYRALPGRQVAGAALADGTRLSYPMNGWSALWVTVGVVGVSVAAGWLPAAVAYDQFGPLLTTANLAATLLGVFLIVQGRRAGGGKASGSALRDYVTGVTLNPRLGWLDLKFFCEGRPGLILWVLFDGSFAAAQWQRHGRVTVPMLLVLVFQLFYVADYFAHERAVLSTWDIRHERFGWALAWGDLVWVPFIYSLQAHYLVDHAHELSSPAAAAIAALDLAGYVVFRGANLQKHRFRENPAALIGGRPAEFIRTAQGALLLTSGWWSRARHANYLGDVLMAIAWSLPTGFRHALPWFYPVFLAALLVHRERRDDAACLAKYGEDWAAYCRKVPWRIVPGIY
jgi:protein-S-isoprenylcysteine O-methyltransferase Ste14